MELGNLLEQALSVLPAVNFYYRLYEGETRNELGVKIPSYGQWLSCRGMVQPVNRSKYEDLGLDFAKNYINVWGTLNLKTVGLQNQPDQILWNSCIWTITAVNEWFQYNNWVNVTAVQDKRVDSMPTPFPPMS